MKYQDMTPIQFIEHMAEAQWQAGASYRLASRVWLAHNQEVASTKEEPAQERGFQKLFRLQERRRSLLERIQEAQERVYSLQGELEARIELDFLQDELAAVESALGFPEPKEPRKASDEPAEATQDYCPTCLCLLEHEDPMQSCQCGGGSQ